jgi:hypothetical protein
VGTWEKSEDWKYERVFYSVFALTDVAPSFTSPLVQVAALEVSSFTPFHVAEHPVQSNNAVAISSVYFILIPFSDKFKSL